MLHEYKLLIHIFDQTRIFVDKDQLYLLDN